MASLGQVGTFPFEVSGFTKRIASFRFTSLAVARAGLTRELNLFTLVYLAGNR
jgi:hypothetical protein